MYRKSLALSSTDLQKYPSISPIRRLLAFVRSKSSLAQL